MSQVLYRKYRPQNFSEVIGQEQIVSNLQSALKKGAISHAYLFHGGRGTGKTSIARILARELGTTASDLYEIDAASNRGIDDIRELREGVRTLPFESKYKVYIVDEAHMLTKEAWNALLKTLEEPPSHALFVLATTELHKVPDTILSRCEVHTFREPSQATLSPLVKQVAKAEGYEIDNGTAELVAMLGEGSFRDTLGVLQKVLGAAKGKSVSESDVEIAIGVPRRSLVREFLKSFVAGEKDKALGNYHEALSGQASPKVFLKLVLHLARMALLLKISKEDKKFVAERVSVEELSFLEALIKDHGANVNSKVLLALITAYAQIQISPIPELPIELAIASIIDKN